MTIVECFGLPGSGKSYLAEKLVDGLTKECIPAIDRENGVHEGLKRRNDGPFMNALKKRVPGGIWRRIVHEDMCLQEMLDCIVRYPGLVSSVFQCLESVSIAQDHKRSIIGAIARTCVEYTLTEDTFSNYEVLVADEWFCHRFHTVFGNCSIDADVDLATKFAQSIPLSGIGIFITTSPELCLERMRLRKRFPEYLEGMTEKGLEDNINISYRNFQKLASALNSTKMRVINYDGVNIEPVLKECAAILKVM